MAKVIAVANQKGGVGKTTTAVNLCCALHSMGKRSLLWDSDPQGNATTSMGGDKNRLERTAYDVLIQGADPEEVVIKTDFGDLIPANKAMAGAGIELIGMADREYILKKAVDRLRDSYDYIIIDCPPSLELLTLNSLCAADSLLIPVQCEYFALEGLSDLIGTVRIIKRKLNRDLEIEGVLLTMFDSRTNLSYQVADEVKRYFKDKVYATVIPRNIRLSEAPSFAKPGVAYDRSSKGSQAYLRLASEVIKKNEC